MTAIVIGGYRHRSAAPANPDRGGKAAVIALDGEDALPGFAYSGALVFTDPLDEDDASRIESTV